MPDAPGGGAAEREGAGGPAPQDPCGDTAKDPSAQSSQPHTPSPDTETTPTPPRYRPDRAPRAATAAMATLRRAEPRRGPPTGAAAARDPGARTAAGSPHGVGLPHGSRVPHTLRVLLVRPIFGTGPVPLCPPAHPSPLATGTHPPSAPGALKPVASLLKKNSHQVDLTRCLWVFLYSVFLFFLLFRNLSRLVEGLDKNGF